jgi:uncharacterized protein YndB with AHSA1/START domain
MNREYISTSSIAIEASADKVWKALTDPTIIQEYMHGIQVNTTWALFSPITFTGIHEGQYFIDKGIILENKPERVLSYSYWSPLWGMEDFEDNYTHITFHLSAFEDNTDLIVVQDNLTNENEVEKSEIKWIEVLRKIKSLVER